MGHVHVLHTAPQTRLYSSRIPSEDPHHRRPAQTRKDGPCIGLHLFSQLSSHSRPFLTSPLYRQFCECKHDSGEDVYDNLLVDAALYAAAEDGVTAYEAGEEGVKRAFFACGRCTAQIDQGEFVNHREGGQVAGMSARCFVNQTELLSDTVERSEMILNLVAAREHTGPSEKGRPYCNG